LRVIFREFRKFLIKLLSKFFKIVIKLYCYKINKNACVFLKFRLSVLLSSQLFISLNSLFACRVKSSLSVSVIMTSKLLKDLDLKIGVQVIYIVKCAHDVVLLA